MRVSQLELLIENGAASSRILDDEWRQRSAGPYTETHHVKPGNNLIRHGAIVLAGTLGANVLGYFFQVSMSRLLGVSAFGSLLGLFSIVTLIAIPALVAQAVVARKIASYADAHRVDRIRRFVRTVVPCSGVVALGVAVAISLARAALAHFLRSDDEAGLVIVSWAALFYATLPIINGVLQGEQRFRRLAISGIVDASLRAILAIVFVRAGYGVNGALCAIALGAMTGTLLSSLFVADLLRAPESRLEPTKYWTNITTSVRLSAGILVISGLASVDVLLVKHYLTVYEAGLFGSLSLIGRIVYLIASFVPTVVLPKAAARVSDGHSPIPILIQSAIVFGLTLSTVLIPLLAFPAIVLRAVAGNAYAGAAPLLALYGSAIAFLAAANAAANFKIGVSRFGFVLPVIIIGGAELGLIAFEHDSLTTIVKILAGGHFLIFIATVSRIWVYEEKQAPLASNLARDAMPL